MTIVVEKYIGGKRYIEGYFKTDESKPTDNIALGSKLTEVNSGTAYYYIDETSGWAVPSDSGGGGEIIVVPLQDVTITDSLAMLTVADGVTIPDTTPDNWTVTINGVIAEYSPDIDGSAGYYVNISDTAIATVIAGGGYIFFLATLKDGSGTFVPGTYAVKITEPDSGSGEAENIVENSDE